MRSIIYICIVLAMLFVPLDRVNIADLLPIEAVAVYLEGTDVILETDTENVGSGRTVDEALGNLKRGTPGVVYLDTVKYLIISPEARSHYDDIKRILKPRIQVYEGEAAGAVKDAVEYLHVHHKLPDWSVYQESKKNIENFEKGA